MIDMSTLYKHGDYPAALESFNKKRKWNKFKPVQLKVANHKCPICECPLKAGEQLERESKKGVTTVEATIDHYRPQELYRFLTYEPTNYILMCSECNRYKGSSFPLYPSTATRATTKAQLKNELPLLANPITDDLLDLFTLNFLYSSSGKKVLELTPKHHSGDLFEKAVETINLFGLGDCEAHDASEHVKSLRVTLLHSHFKKFEGFLKAFEARDVKAMKREEKSKQLEQYGFHKFIVNNQYQNLLPN